MIRPVAVRYADALYELAAEKGVVDEVATGLATVNERLAADADRRRRFFDRLVAESAKKSIVGELTDGCHPLVANALNLLVVRNRSDIVLEMILAFVERMERDRGVLRVTVETALPLDDVERARVVARLGEATGKTIVPEVRVVPELLGGMRLVVDSRRLDGSVRRRLDSLASRLKAAV